MGFCVCGGAILQCSFGTMPAPMNVLPAAKVVSNMALATIMDNAPMVNIPTFLMCKSLLNPTVASATAAALGTLTPMPCTPMTTAPWAPGSQKTMIGGKPALTNSSKLVCTYGGVIEIKNPGTTNIMMG